MTSVKVVETINLKIVSFLMINILNLAGHESKNPFLDSLAQNHDSHIKYVRPLKQLNRATVTELGISLNQLIDLDVNNQLMVSNLWIRLFWQDPSLAWNPNSYNKTEFLHIPAKEIWLPDIVLYNNIDTEFHPSIENLYVTLKYNGEISFFYPAIVKTSCDMNIKYFPFDQQVCKLKFGSWNYDVNHLDLQLMTTTYADFSTFDPHSGWALINFTAQASSERYMSREFAIVTFYIKFRRLWTLHFLYLLMPNLLTNITAIVQFLLPCDSGEKISLSITIYLSMVVYLLILEQILPSSEHVPIIVQYIITTIILVSLSQTLNIIALNIHHRGAHDNHRRVPSWLRKIFLHAVARFLGFKGLIVPDKIHEQIIAQADAHHPTAENQEENDEITEIKEESTPPAIINDKMLSHKNPHGKDAHSKAHHSKHHRGRSYSVHVVKDPNQAMSYLHRNDLKTNEELLLYKIMRIGEEHLDQMHLKNAEAEILCEWQQVAMVIDRLTFYIYIFVTVLAWATLFSEIPTYSEPTLI